MYHVILSLSTPISPHLLPTHKSQPIIAYIAQRARKSKRTTTTPQSPCKLVLN
jgi:hypothetical protein